MKFTVTTGFGYFKDSQGNIVSKAKLGKGNHPIADGFTYHEVIDQTALDAIEIHIDPEQIKLANDAAKISAALEKLAVAEVKKTGSFESIKYKAK